MSTKSLSKKQIKKIVSLIMKWCVDHLGENTRIKKELIVEIEYGEVADNLDAEYEIEEDRVIRLFMRNNTNISQIICSVIHEYAHDLQPVTTQYDKLHKKYGYKHHPHEIKARKMENKFLFVCWEDLKSKIEKIILDKC